MRRRTFIASLGGAFVAAPSPARAQPKSTALVGYLGSTAIGANSAQLAGIRQGLREGGYLEGQNLTIEIRFAEGVYDRLPGLLADLLARKVDLIITQAPPAARAARAATTAVPIVFGVGSDPVAEGLVASLARPGGNLTGVSLLGADLMPKRLELLSELVPKGRRFALLFNPNNPNSWIGSLESAARAKGVQLQMLKAATAGEVDAAFATMVDQRVEGLLLGEDTFLSQRPQIVELALRNRIPTIGLLRQFAAIGGLASYGTDFGDAYRQIGVMAARILKGAKPADLPVQQPAKFEAILNLKTAKALGLTISPSILAQADEVIE